MPKFACMSLHAFKRVRQRTKMTWQEVANLLDRKIYVDSGHVPGSSRHHLVFYSPVDQNCFVAIQDIRSGSVITILPLNYQAQLTWAVSNETCARAKALFEEDVRLAAKQTADRTKVKQLAHAEKINCEKKFVVSMRYIDTEGRPKICKLLSVPASRYDFEVQNFLKNKDLPDLLQNRLLEVNVIARCINSLTIRTGKTIPAVVINFQ